MPSSSLKSIIWPCSLPLSGFWRRWRVIHGIVRQAMGQAPLQFTFSQVE